MSVAGDDHPGARSGHTISAWRDGQLLFGGLTQKSADSESSSNDLYRLDEGMLKWQRVTTVGAEAPRVFAHAAAAVGPRRCSFVVFAGMMNGGAFSDEMALLDDASLRRPSWHTLPRRSPWPSARWGHGAIALEGNLLVFGGTGKSEKSLNDTWQWHFRTQEWERVTCAGKAPGGRRRHSCVEHESNMYVFGGRDGEGQHFDDLHVLDTQRWLWRKIDYAAGPRPAPRVGHSAAMIGSLLIVTGGSSVQPSMDSGYLVLTDAYAAELPPVDGGDTQWERLETDDLPRRTMAAGFGSGSSVYIYGGRDTQTSSASLCSIAVPHALVKRSRPPQPRPVKGMPKVPVNSVKQPQRGLIKHPLPAPGSAAPTPKQPQNLTRGPPPPAPRSGLAEIPINMPRTRQDVKERSLAEMDLASPFSRFFLERVNREPSPEAQLLKFD